MSSEKGSKKWLIGIIVFVVLGVVSAVWYYERSTPKVFTKTEYVKEVIAQNVAFEKVLDDFLGQVFSYDGGKEATEKLENTATKFPAFVDELESKLKPRVPHEAKNHYDNMISAYKIYLEAIDMYKRAVPKSLGEERTKMMQDAENKLNEAKTAMKNNK